MLFRSIMVYHRLLNISSLCYIVGPCCLSTVYTIAYIMITFLSEQSNLQITFLSEQSNLQKSIYNLILFHLNLFVCRKRLYIKMFSYLWVNVLWAFFFFITYAFSKFLQTMYILFLRRKIYNF